MTKVHIAFFENTHMVGTSVAKTFHHDAHKPFGICKGPLAPTSQALQFRTWFIFLWSMDKKSSLVFSWARQGRAPVATGITLFFFRHANT